MQNEIDISSITWDETDSSGIDVSSITWDEEATQENKFSESKIDIAKDVIGNRMNDVAVGLTQGAAQAGKAVLGAADLGLAASNEFSPVTQIRRAAGHDAKAPTIIGGINEVYGGDLFKEAQTAGDQLKTPEMQLAKKAVDTGFDEGLIEGAIALGKNPLAISDMAVQSLPQMATLAVAARQKAAQIFMEAGGGEAGKAAIQQALPMLSKYSLSLEAGQSGGGYAGDKSADGLTPQELAGAGLSAAGTYAGGTLARKLGFGDVEAAQIAEKYGVGTMTGLVSNFIKKGAAEAVEETPQSVFETMGANVGDGKPLMEGTGRAAVEGAAAGFATGGAMSLSQRSGGQASTDQTVNGIRPEGFGAQTATDMPSRDQFETDADYQAAFNEAMDAKEKQTAEPMTESATVAPVEKTQEEIDHDTEVQKYAEGLKTQAEKEGIDAEAKAAKDAMTRAEKNMKAVAGLDPSEPGYQAAYQSLSEALALKKAVESKKVAFDEKVKHGDLMSRDDIVNLNKDAESEMQVSRNLNKQVDEMQSEIDVANPPDWMSKDDINNMAARAREDARISKNIAAETEKADSWLPPLEPDMVQEISDTEAAKLIEESKPKAVVEPIGDAIPTETTTDEDGDITDETQVPMFMKMASDAKSDLIKQGRVVRALSFQAETRPELSQKLSEERAKLHTLSSRYWNMAEKRVAPKVPLSWKAKQKFNAAKRSLKKSIDDVKFLLGGKTKQRSITFIERKDIAKAKADEQAMRDIARKKRPVPIQKGDNAPLAMKADKAEGKKTSAEIKAAIDKALPFLKGHIEVIDSIEDLGADTKDKLKAIGADGTERAYTIQAQARRMYLRLITEMQERPL